MRVFLDRLVGKADDQDTEGRNGREAGLPLSLGAVDLCQKRTSWKDPLGRTYPPSMRGHWSDRMTIEPVSLDCRHPHWIGVNSFLNT